MLSEQVGVGVLCCTQELSKQVGVGVGVGGTNGGQKEGLAHFLSSSHTPRKLTHSASRKVIAGHHVNIISITTVPPAILPIFLAY